MTRWLDVDTIAFEVLGYPLSLLELVGTVLYLASVCLVAQRRILSWPVGIVASLLYAALFYQVRLYADAAEQVYFVGAGLYGWWFWRRAQERSGVMATPALSSVRTLVLVLVGTTLSAFTLGSFISRVHLLAPSLFPQAAAFPYLDAFTTMMSFTALGLMAVQRLESWAYWIVVDVIGIGLYHVQGVRFVALLYVVLLVLAVIGLVDWYRAGPRTWRVVARL